MIASKEIKKSKRGRSRSHTTLIMARMSDDELATVNGWIAENGAPFVTWPEAIRRFVARAVEAE